MATRKVNPIEEVVGRGQDAGLDATRNRIQAGHKGKTQGGRYSILRMGFDDQTVSVDGGLPKPVHGVPSDVIARNRIREASKSVFPKLECREWPGGRTFRSRNTPKQQTCNAKRWNKPEGSHERHPGRHEHRREQELC